MDVSQSRSLRNLFGELESHQEKILTYCTLLVPICSSRKGEYDGILVCTPIVNIDKSYTPIICTKADLNQSVDPYMIRYWCRKTRLGDRAHPIGIGICVGDRARPNGIGLCLFCLVCPGIRTITELPKIPPHLGRVIFLCPNTESKRHEKA